ncbi:hypothetical protein V490_06897 [Pseudogymnoascus sp. VKM F-3557]|nr:hypothetical protein V490_06897 [Pseudogymnoascus sp. VKM F-3557]
MGISAEAIIGLVALFVTCPPSALLIYSWAIRRQRSDQERGMTPQSLAARLNTAWFRDEGAFEASQNMPSQE